MGVRFVLGKHPPKTGHLDVEEPPLKVPRQYHSHGPQLRPFPGGFRAMHSRYTSSLSFRGKGRRAATRPPRTSPGGEKAADTFYRRSQLRLARQGWLVMPGGERGEGWREERERERGNREEREGWRD